jgi:hypothetical protein
MDYNSCPLSRGVLKVTSKRLKQFRGILIFLLSLVVAGCFAKSSNEPSVKWGPERFHETEPSQQPTAPLSKPTVTTDISRTLIPSTPTFVLSPTYLAGDIEAIIQNAIRDNGGCKLPCIWGIDPNKTNPEQAQEFFSRLGKEDREGDFYLDKDIYDDMASLYVIIWNELLRTYFNLSYFHREEKIENIVLSVELTQQHEGRASITPVFGDPYFSELVNYYLLPQVLSRYEIPTKILLLTYPDNPDREDIKPLFSMVLLYEDLGFLVEYLFPRESNGDNFIGCPSKTAYITLVSWDANTKPLLENMVQRISGLGINKLNYSEFRTLEDVTTMQIDDFEDLFKSNDEQACISTPKYRWNHVH